MAFAIPFGPILWDVSLNVQMYIDTIDLYFYNSRIDPERSGRDGRTTTAHAVYEHVSVGDHAFIACLNTVYRVWARA